jgi:hypothetical protein
MDRRSCGHLALLILVVVAILVGGWVFRWQAADRDAARCVGVGANPVVMTDGRVECVK